jgi:3-isopropylmalate/(R)-2-methylmalate dehydratase small subunit
MSYPGVVESSTFCLPVDNIDTDQIIPGQFLTTTEREGLGRFCFYSWRFDESGNERPDSPLIAFDAQSQQVLVAGSNFGCGSSREHAPWALLDFGFRAVISSQFADIFRNNSLKNGLLPVQVDKSVADHLLANPGLSVRVDISSAMLSVEGLGDFEFPLDPFSAYCLTRGINQMDFLLENEPEIRRFEQES